MPFTPGQSGNPRGRPKGSRNKTTVAVRDWATGIVEDPQVQARLLADARAGKLHPSVLTVLLVRTVLPVLPDLPVLPVLPGPLEQPVPMAAELSASLHSS